MRAVFRDSFKIERYFNINMYMLCYCTDTDQLHICMLLLATYFKIFILSYLSPDLYEMYGRTERGNNGSLEVTLVILNV